jgi:predicted acylesterase/phospholipase RssA
VNTLPNPERQYDVVTGVSVGSINSAGISLFGKGQELEMADFMIDLWAKLSNPDVYEAWSGSEFNPIYGITDKSGYMNN